MPDTAAKPRKELTGVLAHSLIAGLIALAVATLVAALRAGQGEAMRRLTRLTLILAALALPFTPASSAALGRFTRVKDPRSCGTITYPDLGAPAAGEGGEHGAAYETVTVVKGPVNCKEAREIARKDPYAADSALPYTRKGWRCRYNKGCTHGPDNRITARYRYETGREKIEKRGEKVEKEECEAQVLVSLGCEEKGYGEAPALSLARHKPPDRSARRTRKANAAWEKKQRG